MRIFYWDIYFVLNFIMNLFFLVTTAVMRRKAVRVRRLVLSAAVGSAQLTAIVAWQKGRMLSGHGAGIVGFLLAVLLGWEMLQITFREKILSEKMRNLWAMLQCSIATGGVILLLREQFLPLAGGRFRKFLLPTGMAGVLLVLWWEYRICTDRERQNHILDGILEGEDGGRYKVRALYDTGNQLISPYSGEGVAIISEELAEQMKLEETQNPLWIPFHSVGGDGLLPAYRLACLTLPGGQKKEHILAAVSDTLSKDSSIQMILSGKE